MVWEQETENSAAQIWNQNHIESLYSPKFTHLVKDMIQVITGSQYGARVVTVHAKIVNLLYCLVCDTATRS